MYTYTDKGTRERLVHWNKQSAKHLTEKGYNTKLNHAWSVMAQPTTYRDSMDSVYADEETFISCFEIQ